MTHGPHPLPIRHGTTYGYRAHLKRYEFPCLDCRRAERRRRSRKRDADEFAAVWATIDPTPMRERRAAAVAESDRLRDECRAEMRRWSAA